MALLFLLGLLFIIGINGDMCDLEKAIVEDCEITIKSTLSLSHDINTFTNVSITCDTTDSDYCIEVPSDIYLSMTGCRVNGNSKSKCIEVAGSIFVDKSYISACGNDYFTVAGAIYQKGENSVTVISNSFIEDNAYGAIKAEGKLTVQNSIFKNNTKDTNYGSQSYVKGGAAILISGSTSQVKISSCTFINNLASDHSYDYNYLGGGGAIYLDQGTCDISNSEFQLNTGKWYGGAIFNSRSGHLSISNSLFHNNSAVKLGGSIYNQGELKINSTEFNYNVATKGGMLYNSYGNSKVTIINTTTEGNQATEDTKSRNIHSDAGDFAIGIQSYVYFKDTFYFTKDTNVQLIYPF